MNLEEELKLSFYKEIASVSERHGVVLVQHVDTGKVYVKKTLKHFDRTVFEYIYDDRPAGVPVVKELIESEGTLIVIEDYISGHGLDELLAKGPMRGELAVRIISDLCDILKPFHSHDPVIVHRDIKDSNVIIDNEGKVYLIDFDASKKVIRGKSRDTDLIGTEEYAAPEQYGFGQSDQRTDIYALGVLLNKMLTGQLPSQKKYEGSLSAVISKATAIDPANRYQNAAQLQDALNRADGVIDYSYEITDEATDEAAYETAEATGLYEDDGLLKRLLSFLPYPIRELPGFRSGSPLYFCIAIVCYGLLIALGFFGVARNPEYTPKQNKFYDIATFLLILMPSLYLGNYLGIRDRMPWRKADGKWLEVLRICAGTALVLIVVFALEIIASLILNV